MAQVGKNDGVGERGVEGAAHASRIQGAQASLEIVADEEMLVLLKKRGEKRPKLFRKGNIPGLTNLRGERNAAPAAFGIEIKGDGDTFEFDQAGKKSSLHTGVDDDFVIGFDVVNGAESDGEGRDGRMLGFESSRRFFR